MSDNHDENNDLSSEALSGRAASLAKDAVGEGHSDHDDVSALHERISQLENRLVEQDHMIRHALTMLIEWIETPNACRQAA